MTHTIADNVVLLSINPATARPYQDWDSIDRAIGGAILAELALRGHAVVVDKKVQIVDHSPIGDTLLDAAQRQIETSNQSPDKWIRTLGDPAARHTILDRLIAAGLVRHDTKRRLGVYTTHSYAPVGAETVDGRLRDVLGGANPEPAEAVLIGLLNASEVLKKRFGKVDPTRVAFVTEGQWATESLRSTLDAINTEFVLTTVIMTTLTTTMIAND